MGESSGSVDLKSMESNTEEQENKLRAGVSHMTIKHIFHSISTLRFHFEAKSGLVWDSLNPPDLKRAASM